MSLKTLPLVITFLCVLLTCGCLNAYSQTIQYSRQRLSLPGSDSMKLVANISGNHHLLFFKKNSTPFIYIFDKELQPLGKKELQVKSIESGHWRVIPFRNFYFLHLPRRDRAKHELWRINAQGDATSLSDKFQNFIDSTLIGNTSVLQLINKDGELVVMEDAYYGDLKIMVTTIARLDENLDTLSVRTVSYPFQRGPNLLNQVTLIGENLFILKSTRLAQNYSVELIKANLTTGKSFRKQFTSSDNFTRNAAFRYVSADSSILIHSTVGSQVFVSKVNLSLKEVSPPTLLNGPFSSNVSNFLLVSGEAQEWLATNLVKIRPPSQTTRSAQPIRSTNGYRTTFRSTDEAYNIGMYGSTPTGFGSYDRALRYPPFSSTVYTDPDVIPAVRFSVVNKDFKLSSDSVVSNKKSKTTVWASQFSNVMMGNKSYLILQQDLPRAKQGLLLVSADGNNQLLTRDITVFEKYEYLLANAQTISNEGVLLPFIEKSQVGLVKISFSKMDR